MNTIMSDQYSFLKNDSAVAERLNSVYEKDFTIYFSSCSKRLKVNRILADLISPRIFKNHYAEKCNKGYHLNRNSDEIDFNILSFIFKKLKIPTMKEIKEIDKSEKNKENNKNDTYLNKEEKNQQEKEQDFLIKMLKLFKELGNEEAVKYLLEKEFKNKEMNKELFEKIIEIEKSINETQEGEENYDDEKEYSIYKMIEYEEIKKYGANHFEEVKEIIKKYFSKNEMKEIIEEENFKIKEEYNLLKFIKEIISERGEEFKEMVEYIKYENLTIKEFEEFLEMIEPKEIGTEEWHNIIKKVMKFINKSKDNNISESKSGGRRMLKLLLLGDDGVGKTSLLDQLVNHEFTMQYKATFGSCYYSKQLDIDGKDVALQIWDTSGQERYRSLVPMYCRGTDCCIFVYDVTKQKSFENIKKWRSEFCTQIGFLNNDKFAFCLLGNKSDLPEKAVQPSAAREFAQKNGDMLFFEVSAKTADNVNTFFEAIVRRTLEKRP